MTTTAIGINDPDFVVDANDEDAVTREVNVAAATGLTVYALETSGGSMTTAVFTVQFSPDDGRTWISSSTTLTGQGFTSRADVRGHRLARVKVTTPEGSAVTARIIINTDTFTT